MATIKDVAKLAQVSHGTVSNVIKGIHGVSLDKVKRVEEAIKVLGYKPNVYARGLKSNKTKNVGIVIPNIFDPAFVQIYTSIKRVLDEHDYMTSLHVTNEIIANENKIIRMAESGMFSGLVIATCQPSNYQPFKDLLGAGINIVTFERSVKGLDCDYVGFDNYQHINGTVKDLISQGYKAIALITGPKSYTSESQCIKAYKDAIKDVQQPIMARTNYDKESAFKASFKLLRQETPPDAIITSSIQLAEGLMGAISYAKAGLSKIPRVFSLSEDTWSDNSYSEITKLSRQTYKMGETIANIVLDNFNNQPFNSHKKAMIESNNNQRLELAEQQNINPINTFRQTDKIRAIMLAGEASYATESLINDFKSKSGIDVELHTYDYEQIYDVIKEQAKDSFYDIFLVDIPWLDEFIQTGVLTNLDAFVQRHPELLESIVPEIVDDFAKNDDSCYAVPYLFCNQILFYRKDLFEDTKYKRMFYEQYKSELRPPQNWIEFNAVGKFFTKEFNEESPTEYGTTLGGSYSSAAYCEFLPRMWAFGGDIIDKNGQVILNSSQNINALKNYCDSYKYADPSSKDFWWNEQVDEFAQGRAAMMVLFSAHASDITDRSKSVVVGEVGYDSIPGGIPLLGGWSLGINNNSKNKEEAFEFIRWACNQEIAIPSTILGGFAPCKNFYYSSELASIYPWVSKSLEDYQKTSKRVSYNLPNGKHVSVIQCEKIIAKAVRDAITSQITPEDALKVASQKINDFIKS